MTDQVKEVTMETILEELQFSSNLSNFSNLSNLSITPSFVEKHAAWNWKDGLSTTPSITQSFIEKYFENDPLLPSN